MIRLLALACLALFLPGGAWAHKPSDSYLSLRVEGDRMSGRWDIALRDLEHALGIDADGDGAITWGEVRARHDAIASYALARLRISDGGRACAPRVTDHLVDTHTDGPYAVLQFEVDCGAPVGNDVRIEYSLFFDLDPTHLGLLNWQANGRTATAVLGPDSAAFRPPVATSSRLSQFLDYLKEGVWHIGVGIDHVLFLVSLLLPAVFAPLGRGWTPVERFMPAFWDVVKIVTAFTIAHSITLSAAALSVVSLPSRWVETAIAFSVLAAALNNLWPLVQGRRWVVAFVFGLIHGFGFASVLSDLGLPQDALLLALVGFNLGVEAGQLLIVALFLPLAFGARRTLLYRRVVLGAGSAVIACVALAWMIERWFDLQLLS